MKPTKDGRCFTIIWCVINATIMTDHGRPILERLPRAPSPSKLTHSFSSIQPSLTTTGTQPYRTHWSAPAAGPRRLSGPAAQSSHSHQYHTASRPRTGRCQVGRSGRRRRRHLHSAVSKNVSGI